MISETDSSYYSEEDEQIEEPEEWFECVVDSDYEISNKYPYHIRRKGTKRHIAQTLNKANGYLQSKINKKNYYLHRIIAKQFIPNDNPEKDQVDHINRIKTDNHISNLRWVNALENVHNRGGIYGSVYTDEIDEETIKIETYGNRKLENYYYDFNLDQFYHYEDGKYRLLNVLHRKNGNEFMSVCDRNGVKFHFYTKRFKKLFELE